MRRFAITALLAAVSFSQPAAAAGNVFVGSTPCNENIRGLLDIPLDANAELIEWELSLSEAGQNSASGTYELRFRFGKTRPNQPGLDDDAPTRERRGTWRIETETLQQQAAAIVKLDGGVSLRKVGDTILHLVEADGRLMAGNGGWSYTLSRRDAVEKNVPATLAAADPGDAPRTDLACDGSVGLRHLRWPHAVPGHRVGVGSGAKTGLLEGQMASHVVSRSEDARAHNLQARGHPLSIAAA